MPALVSVAVSLALAGRRSDVARPRRPPTSARVSRRSSPALLTPTARLARLVAGYRRGELAYFVVLGERERAGHRAALERAGARILREYRELDAFAVASQPRRGGEGRRAARRRRSSFRST